MHRRTAKAAALLACVLGIGTTTAHAQEAPPPPPAAPPASGEASGRFEFTAGVDIEHDTNINLSESNPVSQDVLMPTFAFTYNEQGSVLEAHAAGHIQYRDYLGGAFSDEFTGTASGIFDWHILPNRLDWSLEDYVGYQPVNVLANNVPDTNDYDRTDAYGSYVRTGPRSRLEADLGYTWLDFKGGAEDHSGIFLRANGRYDFAEHTVGTLTVSRMFSDAVQFLQVDPSQIGQVVIGSGLNGALVSPSVYKEDRVSGSIEQGGQTYTLSLTPFWYHDTYLNTQDQVVSAGLNTRAYGFYAAYDYRIQQDLTLGAFAGVEKRNYTDLARTDKDYDFGLHLGWQMAQHWASRVALSREIQATNAPNLSYNGSVIAVGVTYSR